MAEALGALSVVANIVQLVDFSSKLLERLQDFSNKGRDLPQTFREVKVGLPLLLRSIEHIRDDLESGAVDPQDEKVLRPVIEGCTEQVKYLNDVLNDTLPSPGDSRWTIIKKTVSSVIYQGERIKAIGAAIETHERHLVLHQVSSPRLIGKKHSVVGQELVQDQLSFSRTGSIQSQSLGGESSSQPISISPQLPALTRISTSLSLSPTETIFDSNFSIRTTSTARTDLTIPTPPAPKPKPFEQERSLLGPYPIELSITEPAIDSPQAIVEATM